MKTALQARSNHCTPRHYTSLGHFIEHSFGNRKKATFGVHGNEGVSNEDVRGIAVYEGMCMKLRTQIENAEGSASFEKKGKGEVIRRNMQIRHTGIKKEGAMVVGIVDEATQHDVPKEGIGREEVAVGKESVGVRNGAKRSVVGDEVGEGVEMEVEGSENRSMKSFKRLERVALLDQGDACVFS